MVALPLGFKNGVYANSTANEVEVFFVKDGAILDSYCKAPVLCATS
jgi:hypothetical protein